MQELVDENPFAVRAVLKILSVEFTDAVPTLAITIEARPRLLINLEFVEQHCSTAEHVKAVLCHEFLHLLLRHTSQRGSMTPARHLAFDAVINAIIHRQLGEEYSSLMSRYYADAQGLMRLLRPMTSEESHQHFGDSDRLDPADARWRSIWRGLYEGTILADDIEQLAQDPALSDVGATRPDVGRLLGNHAGDGPLPTALEEALARAGRELNGSGIWRAAGRGGNPYELLVNPKQVALAQWRAQTLAVLRRHLAPAPGAPRSQIPVTARLPVLSPSDRRAFLRATWSPILPEAHWAATAARPEGRAQVYLDVSGSMMSEMSLIVGLLGQLSWWIRRPFWAFSTDVAPARIEGGVLKAGTSGGTSLACVLEHVAATRPAAAVIVTDGYVERIPKARIAGLRPTRLHAIVTRDGDPTPLKAAGLSYSQLARLPK
ncbi:MAG: hypothetical protein IPF60_17235 [Betaproteobacteria bacterium]|nr:hypothetical protein [Betaproteobacteria bacterium]